MHSCGNSFSNGDSMNAGSAPGAYPEPWYTRLLGPVQPGAVPGSTWGR